MKAGSADYIPYNQALVLKGEKDESEELKEELKKSMQDNQRALQECFNELKVWCRVKINNYVQCT